MAPFAPGELATTNHGRNDPMQVMLPKPSEAETRTAQPGSASPATMPPGPAGAPKSSAKVEDPKITKPAQGAPPAPASQKVDQAKSSQKGQEIPSPHFPPAAKAGQGTSAAKSELEELRRLEKNIETYKTSWIKAGKSLAEIHERKLYRHVAPTFEQYIEEHWDFKTRHAFKMITAWGVARNVRGVSESITLTGALELAKLPKEKQAACLREVKAANGKREPNTADLAAAVAKRLPHKQKKKSLKPKALTIKLKSGTIRVNAGVDPKVLIGELTAWLAAHPPAAA